MRVCGSKRLTTFSFAGTFFPARTRQCLTDDLLDQGKIVFDLSVETLGLVLPLSADLSEGSADLLHLADRGLGCRQEFPIHGFALFRLVLSDPPSQPMQRLETSAHRPQSGTKGIPGAFEVLLDERLTPTDDARQDSDTVGEEAAIGRVVDRRLHHGPIDAQLPALGDLRLPRQLHHSIVEGAQGLRLDGLSPSAVAY